MPRFPIFGKTKTKKKHANLRKINTHKKKTENPRLYMGPCLPFKDYVCFHTCMYYFNIAGNMNDKTKIYLVAFVNDWKNKINLNLILKNNQWIAQFDNHTKLSFPKQTLFSNFDSCFMVCRFYFQKKVLFGAVFSQIQNVYSREKITCVLFLCLLCFMCVLCVFYVCFICVLFVFYLIVKQQKYKTKKKTLKPN